MDFLVGGFLVVVGVAGGIINALAGGATLITFPAMLAAGLPPVIANASNAVAIVPGHLLAVLADREKLPAFDRTLIILCTLCILGGALGSLIVLALPDHIFVLPVPALIGFATLLFAFAPWIGDRAARRGDGRRPSTAHSPAALFAASVYGGFFGAGLGILLSALLSLGAPGDIRRVKVMKNLLATCVSLAAVVVFVTRGAVQWPETLLMLSGALLGGYAGGHLVRVLPGEIVRLSVIAAGAVMTWVYALRYWF